MYGSEEYEGKWIFHQPDGGTDEVFKESFLDMVKTQKPFSCEIIRKHKDGYEVCVELMGIPMHDKKGNIEHMMLVGRNITERKEYEKQLEYLSFHDTLTELPNRRLFKERLEQALKLSKRFERKFAVMYMDMDNFKQINDTLGHDAGDELLRKFSKRVRNYLRESDTISHLGGDEFAILPRGTNYNCSKYTTIKRSTIVKKIETTCQSSNSKEWRATHAYIKEV